MLVYSNIFQPRNDWGVASMRCRKVSYKLAFHTQVAKIIKDIWGTDPLTLKVYQGADEVISRQIFAVMMRTYSKQTFKTIGSYIGKDHATVYASQKSVQNFLDTNKSFKMKFSKIDIRVKELNK